MSAIPERSRLIVKGRERNRCCRCGVPALTGDWHHRRSRRVVDAHTHCPCVGVLLCRTCHTWVHSNPMHAQRTGFTVSMHITEPGTIPVLTPWGERTHDCEGNYTFTNERQP